jgi:ubiquinol-cytochrome c reductase cytochrome b subunit
MSHQSTYQPAYAFTRWLDSRLPILRFVDNHLTTFPTPRNLNYLWTFGAILAICLVIQIVTGIVMAMHYAPHTLVAFDTIEHFVRDGNYGWLMRYMHAVGATMFFAAVYIHMGRGLYYGSYMAPREILWIIGVLIFLAMMATAFMGYSLVWGNMSLWAVTVISNFLQSLDTIYQGLGTTLVEWFRGDFSVSNVTLNRLYSLHYLIPFIIVGLVVLHVWALHVPGNNNPTGAEVQDTEKETLPFHPYYTVKDGFAISAFLIAFVFVLFWLPNYFSHPDNYVVADPLSTPAHITPEWYFLAYYAILKAVPSQLGGVIFMFASIIVMFFAPWLDTSPVKSGKHRSITFKIAFWLLIFSFVALSYLGAKSPEGWYVWLSRVFMTYYFAYFLVLLPLMGFFEKASQQPASITEANSKAH